MRTLAVMAGLAIVLAARPAYAPAMGAADRAAVTGRSASGYTNFSRNAPSLVMTYLVAKNPKVFDSVDRGSGDACLSARAADKDADAACRRVLREIIESIRALLGTSYGLTKSMGRFDPTTVSYSKELTRSLLMLDPQRKI